MCNLQKVQSYSPRTNESICQVLLHAAHVVQVGGNGTSISKYVVSIQSADGKSQTVMKGRRQRNTDGNNRWRGGTHGGECEDNMTR